MVHNQNRFATLSFVSTGRKEHRFGRELQAPMQGQASVRHQSISIGSSTRHSEGKTCGQGGFAMNDLGESHQPAQSLKFAWINDDRTEEPCGEPPRPNLMDLVSRDAGEQMPLSSR